MNRNEHKDMAEAYADTVREQLTEIKVRSEYWSPETLDYSLRVVDISVKLAQVHATLATEPINPHDRLPQVFG